jgi:hypothetical protein
MVERIGALTTRDDTECFGTRCVGLGSPHLAPGQMRLPANRRSQLRQYLRKSFAFAKSCRANWQGFKKAFIKIHAPFISLNAG